VFDHDGFLYLGTACDGVHRSATPVGSPTSVGGSGHGILAAWGSAPNPARGASTVTFDLARSSRVDVAVYDVRGRAVAMLANGRHFVAGAHALRWTPTRDVPSGVYTYRVRAGAAVQSGRIVLVR
jgi:hypothetical protein